MFFMTLYNWYSFIVLCFLVEQSLKGPNNSSGASTLSTRQEAFLPLEFVSDNGYLNFYFL